ncbi:MAG: hypothetical protein JNK15_25095 [Planctomycetes bacterium]|nr:hypothetical protein [Planctomycetota bacterium]
MLIGQTIFIPGSGTPGVNYFGAWMPRHGDALTAVFEVLRASATTGWSIVCKVQTKDSEDSDASASDLGSVTIDAAATWPINKFTAVLTGAKELVRIKFECNGAGTDRWVHMRTNPIIWQPN